MNRIQILKNLKQYIIPYEVRIGFRNHTFSLAQLLEHLPIIEHLEGRYLIYIAGRPIVCRNPIIINGMTDVAYFKTTEPAFNFIELMKELLSSPDFWKYKPLETVRFEKTTLIKELDDGMQDIQDQLRQLRRRIDNLHIQKYQEVRNLDWFY